MGYEIEMQKRILGLLQLFRNCSPDQETHAWVTELVADKKKWPEAHDLFSMIRKRNLATKERPSNSQYSFEELCLKTIFNETNTPVPFDTNSSFWLAGSAFDFARRAGVSTDAVIDVIAPYSKNVE